MSLGGYKVLILMQVIHSSSYWEIIIKFDDLRLSMSGMDLELHLKSTPKIVNDMRKYIDKISSGLVEKNEIKSIYNFYSTKYI